MQVKASSNPAYVREYCTTFSTVRGPVKTLAYVWRSPMLLNFQQQPMEHPYNHQIKMQGSNNVLPHLAAQY
jgi:hypothetical protein